MSIKESIIESNQLKFSFKIENFSKDFKETLESQKFHFAQRKWYIKIYTMKVENFISIYLKKIAGQPIKVSYKMSIVGTNSKVVKAYEDEDHFKDDAGWGWHRFISKKELFEAIAPDYIFTFVCELNLIENVVLNPSLSFTFCDELNRICCTDFHDLTIRVKDQIIQAHRNIVSAYSPVLHKEILKLCGTDPLKIKGFSFGVFQELVNFMYGKKVNKTDENVKEILLASKQYEIHDLQTECEDYIFQKVTLANAFKTLIFADHNQIENLCNEIICFVEKNIDVFLKKQNDWENFLNGHPTVFRRLFEKIFPSFCDDLNEDDKSISRNIITDKTLESNNLSNNLSNDLEKLFETMELSDVVFEVEGKTLSAHKCLLLSRSKVFKAMFNNDCLESKENRIKIADIDYDTMQQLLQYIYCGKVTGLKENAVNLFSAADKYDLMELKELCENSMKQNVTVDNVTDILKLADLHSSYLTDLKGIAMKFFKKNFAKVIETTIWKDFANSNPRILNEMLVKF